MKQLLLVRRIIVVIGVNLLLAHWAPPSLFAISAHCRGTAEIMMIPSIVSSVAFNQMICIALGIEIVHLVILTSG